MVSSSTPKPGRVHILSEMLDGQLNTTEGEDNGYCEANG